jgi:hypothetical protein
VTARAGVAIGTAGLRRRDARRTLAAPAAVRAQHGRIRMESGGTPYVANPTTQWRGGATEHVRNIALDLILTVITVGIYNLWVQHKQIEAVNAMLRQPKYSFLPWLLLSLVTCGIYHIYHEWRKSDDIARVTGHTGSNDALVAVILTILALGWVNDAMQQARINEYFGSNAL